MNIKNTILVILPCGKESVRLLEMLFLQTTALVPRKNRVISDNHSSQFVNGYTILEVVVAVVILSISSSVLMSFLLAGDKIYGRNVLIENAALLARNEAEMLKAIAPGMATIDDNEYEKETGGRLFYIKRRVLETEALDSLTGDYPLKTIEIQVYENRDKEKPLISFKLLQGYHIQ